MMKKTEEVGHVPYNITFALSMFLRRQCNIYSSSQKNVAVSVPVHSVCAECYKRSISVCFRSTSDLDGSFPIQ